MTSGGSSFQHGDERWLDTIAPVGKPFRECTADDLDRCMELLRAQEQQLRSEVELLHSAKLKEALRGERVFTDPAAATLNCIARLPEVLPTIFPCDRAKVQSLCLALDAAGVLDDLPEAGKVAAAIAVDFLTQENAADTLREHARQILGGSEDCWDDRVAAARALNLAAGVLDAWVS